MSNDSGEKTDWGVWLASAAMVLVLGVVFFGGLAWRWMGARPRAPGMTTVVAHTQTLMQPVQFADESAMRTAMDMLPGRTLAEALGLLRVPATAAMAHPDQMVSYRIIVTGPRRGTITLVVDHGQVTGAEFVKE
ncbi:MAG: hypothetical protein WC058_11610 [Phycisphaeraceae bacterium]